MIARILIILCLASSVVGKIEKVNLENGLTLFLRPSKSRSIKTTVIIDAGSEDQKEDQKGVAHFVEHMMAVEQKRHGFVDFHAKTTQKYTWYQFYIKHYSEEAIADTLGTFISNFKIERDGVERQRKIILKEREELNIQTLDESEIIGEKKDIEKISSSMLLQFYYEHYSTKNIAFIIEGSFSKDLLIKAFEKRFHSRQCGEKVSEKKKDFGIYLKREKEFGYFRSLNINNEKDFKKWIAVQFFSEILQEKFFKNEWLKRFKIYELGISTEWLLSPLFYIGCNIDQDFLITVGNVLYEVEDNYLSEGDEKHYEALYKKVLKKEIFKYLNPSWSGEGIESVCLDAFLFGDKRYKFIENKDLMKKVLKNFTYKKMLQELHNWLQAEVEYIDLEKDQLILNDEKQLSISHFHKPHYKKKPSFQKDAFSIEKSSKRSGVICMQGKNGSKLYLKRKKVPYVSICAKNYLPSGLYQMYNHAFLSFYFNTLSKIFRHKHWDLKMNYSENMFYFRSFIEKKDLYRFFDFLNSSFQKDSKFYDLVEHLYEKDIPQKERENCREIFEFICSEYGKWSWFISGDLKPKDFFYDLPFFIESKELESIEIKDGFDEKQIEKQGKLDHLTLYKYTIEIPKYSISNLEDYLNFNIFSKYLRDWFYQILRRNDQFSYTILPKFIKNNDDLFLQYYFYLDKKQCKNITSLVDQFNEILYPQLFDFAFYEYKEKLLTQYKFEMNDLKNYEKHFFAPLEIMNTYSEDEILNYLEQLEHESFLKFCDKIFSKT